MVVLGASIVTGCGSDPSPHPHFKVGQPYKINGNWYHPEFVTEYEAIGIASWYGSPYHGRLTANGELYDMYALTAAHPTLQLPSVVRVTNLDERAQPGPAGQRPRPLRQGSPDRSVAGRGARARLRAAGAGPGPRGLSRHRAPRREADPAGRAARVRLAQLPAARARAPGLLGLADHRPPRAA